MSTVSLNILILIVTFLVVTYRNIYNEIYRDIGRSDFMPKIAKRIKYIRESLKDKDNKWTQGYVAERIGVARVTYTAYENDTKTPPPDIIINIADLFDVTADYLLGRSDNPNKNEDEAFAEFIKDPKLRRWFKSLPESEEEDIARLKRIWDAFKED